MAGEKFDLETLSYILGHFSKDIAGDCPKFIQDLLKFETGLSVNRSLNPQIKNALVSVKVLLSLYEKLCTNNHEIKMMLPVNVVVETIKHLLCCTIENCNLPDIGVQYNILSIVSSLFKIVIIQNSQENIKELVEFYAHTLSSLNALGECKSDCLIFKLKVMTSIYSTFAHVTSAPTEKFLEEIKLIKNFDECQLFASLVLHHNDSVAIQTLMYLIPEYVNCFKSERVLEVTWKQITRHSNIEHFRVLIILCNIFDICFEKSKVKDKIDLTKLLLEDVNYWKLLQFALVEKDAVTRKQGMYLLKKTVQLLNNTNRNFVCDAENIIFYWDSDCKDELDSIYSEIITCLEFLEEQQVHIVKPILKVIETLGKKIIEYDKVNYSWVLLLYKKVLMHESTQIIKWGLNNLLKLPVNFFLCESIVRETVDLLVDALNNMSLYYNNGLSVSRDLKDFFNMVVGLNCSKLFFSLFIKKICSQIWSAEALFFVIHSLSGVQQFSSWGEEEVFEIGTFVSKAFKTHNKIIRTSVQCELLNAIMNLTDTECVPLESLVHLLSKFCIGEITRSQTWFDFIKWLRNSYSKQDADNVLKKYEKTGLGEKFNDKFLSLMLILFDCVFYSDVQNSSALNYLLDILSSFREIDKRPYCDKLLYDRYLSVICHIYETNMNDFLTRMVKPTLVFVEDIILYIRTQLEQISNLQDFNACESYLNSFQVIIHTLTLNEIENNFEGFIDSEDFINGESFLNLFRLFFGMIFAFNVHSKIINDLYVTILKDSEACLCSDTVVSPIGIYWRIKLLSILLEVNVLEPRASILDSYLLSEVNLPLKKDDDGSRKTRDLQTLWGRMNSKFIEGKWKILEFLIANEVIIHEPSNTNRTSGIENGALVKLCVEALNSGGYGVLCPVMSILKGLVPSLEDFEEVRKLVDSVWKLIMERRKTEEFKVFIKHFVELLYQEVFIGKGESAQQLLIEYADLIFSDSSLTVINIFMKHIQQMNILNCSVSLFCHIIGKGLMFGPVQKKDERLTNQVCCHIEFLKICQARKIGDYNTSNEIRARAVQTILTFDPTCTTHQAAARSLIEALLKMEKETNKNRVRYFGNSHVHRVKHRLMQSLLLLEPMLSPNEDQAKELSSWLYHCLMTEHSQPSVRYQQEWLLVRMLLRHSDLYSRYCLSNYNKDFEENNKRSLCSAIAVSYHVCMHSPSNKLEGRMMTTMDEIFSFCFHQHFEVRLYSQVVFNKLYNFAKRRKLTHIIEKFQFINTSVTKIFEKHLNGNFGKNLEKMLEDFYFTKFNPLEHYSLETIYMDLPRLANVDADEWISAEVFQGCGVDTTKIRIPVKNSDPFTEYLSNENKWLAENFKSTETNEGEKSAVALTNYQRKIIPQKPLIPGWDENSTHQIDNLKEDGLVVVASLIDRIPNLGGLARTCEIFGASEYIIGSLKFTEDKQFTSLSVTAEKWITIKEVKTQNLLEYILEMKLKGYTVIGAEQMLHSIPLGSAKFPKKSLLLLGNEKEGIPPNLLPLLDICIEVPQLGIIRSLNVHVTGALFIWEYAKQNHFS